MRPFSLLLAAAAVFSFVRADEFAFFDACAEGDAAAVSAFAKKGLDVNYADENGATPLILAARNGRVEAVGALLDAGADMELAAEYPAQVDTPLSAAVQNSASSAVVVELLLTRGAKLDGRGRDGRTALMAAAARGLDDMVSMLIVRGADIEAQKVDGTTALFWAAHAGHADVVVLLLSKGAKVDRRERMDGSMPIHFACQVIPHTNKTGPKALAASNRAAL